MFGRSRSSGNSCFGSKILMDRSYKLQNFGVAGAAFRFEELGSDAVEKP